MRLQSGPDHFHPSSFILHPSSFLLVDPTGLKPAPNGLKVRCSVTRAPGQYIADCQLPIVDWSLMHEESTLEQSQIGNRQLAIGNVLAVAEGFEPSHGRINNAVPYQLGYATKNRHGERETRGRGERNVISL